MKAVIFDCFGVLTVDSWTTYVSGLPDSIQGEVDSLVTAYDRGVLAEGRLFDEVQTITGHSRAVIAAAMGPKSVKNTELIAYMRKLKASDLKIGMLSNINNNWVTEEFLTADEVAIFDGIVLSHHIHVTKPHPEAFFAVASQLGLEPNECIMVDDLEKNCIGAETAGMKSVLFTSNREAITKINQLIGSE